MSLSDLLKKGPFRPQSTGTMTLAEHLGELRRRIVICLIAFSIGAVIAFLAYGPLLSFLRAPYCHADPGNCSLYVTAPLDGLTLRIQIAAFGGLLLASPILLFEVWRFITPGLKHNEKRYAIPFVVASITLFLAGCALAYLVFEHALVFLKTIGGPDLKQIYNPNQYLSLLLWMMFLFGITFEFPVVLVALQLARVVTPKQLLAWWRWAIIAITLVSAIFTPSGDPLSMLALAIPLTAFYFISILIGRLARR